MTYVIAEPCVDVKDLSCIEECPVDCIYIGASMAYIHPDECVDCGACEPVCPVEAIYYEDEVPGEWTHYISANADFFNGLGSPGGATKTGVLPFDAPQVKSTAEPVVRAPASLEATTVDLFDIVSGDRRSGYVLAAPLVDPGGGLEDAIYLLFDGVVSIGGRAASSVSRVALDNVLLPFDKVSVSAMIESAVMARSAGLLRNLRAEPFHMETQRAVVERAYTECAGRPVKDVLYLYDKEALSLVANLVPLLLLLAMKRRDAHVYLITDSFEHASFIRTALAGPGPRLRETTAFDPEIVLPDLSQFPQPLLATFRDSYGNDLAYHVTRMVELANENAVIDNTDDRQQHWIAARKEIANHGSKLWRLTRASFPGARGDVALGIIRGSVSRLPPNGPSIAERLFAVSGLEQPQDEPMQIFFLTRFGRKGR